MMYRSGYGTKDEGQARVLAIRMKHEHFQTLLEQATVTGHSNAVLTPEESQRPVRVQWDPERNHKLEVLPFRSIQIGIGGEMSKTWADRYVDSIEEVTDKAHALKRIVEEKSEIGEAELIEMGLVPWEKVYEVSEELRAVLKMDVGPGPTKKA